MTMSKKKDAADAAPKSSVDKTHTLERKMVPVEQLHPDPRNPNEMDTRQYNLLVDNMEKMGFTDPILARPHPDIAGELMIVGGEHRWEVAKSLGYTEVPVTLITDPSFTEDEAAFQIVRHNIIGGKMDPAKFLKLYESLGEKYSEGVTAELFGFADEAEFKKLINTTKKSLPKEMQAQFSEAAKDLKSIDDLAKLLNQLFAKHGETLPHGYMFMDFGGQESVWLQLQKSQLKNFTVLAEVVRTEKKALDHVFDKLLADYAKGDGAARVLLDGYIASCPEVKVKADADYATLDFLD